MFQACGVQRYTVIGATYSGSRNAGTVVGGGCAGGDGGRHARRRARRNGIAGDAVAAKVAGDDAGDTGDAGLGRAVVRLSRVAAQAGDRREIDDAAVALMPEDDAGRLDRVELAREVDGDHVVPLFLG